MSEIPIPEDPRISFFGQDTPTPQERTADELRQLREKVGKLQAERDEFERKGKDLCCAYGNALITEHDLRNEIAALKAENARLKQPVTDKEWKKYSFEVEETPVAIRRDINRLLTAREKEAK